MITPSFRGIPFHWQERGGETTPRFAEHEWPQKNGRWHEDMGQGPRVFTVIGFLLGGSPELARAKLRVLMRACRDQRPGTLIHPTFGAVKCVCTGFKHKETIEKRGRIELDMTFVEDEGATAPIAGRWPGAALGEAVDDARDAIGSGLDQVWNLVSMPGYVLDQAGMALEELAAEVFGTLGLVTAEVRGTVTGRLGLFGGVSNELRGLSAPMVGLLAAFTTGGNGRLLSLTPPQAEATARVLGELATFTLATAPTPTFSRAVAAQAVEGLAVTVRRLALVEEANVSRLRSFPSAVDAISVRDDLADRLDTEIVAAADRASTDGNDVLMRISDALAGVRSEVIADLTARAASLKPVAHITLPQVRSSFALAYALYGDGDGQAGDRAATLQLALDLPGRNRVRDPGVMPGGVPLEYLVA